MWGNVLDRYKMRRFLIDVCEPLRDRKEAPVKKAHFPFCVTTTQVASEHLLVLSIHVADFVTSVQCHHNIYL